MGLNTNLGNAILLHNLLKKNCSKLLIIKAAFKAQAFKK